MDPLYTLAFDVGGNFIKAAVLNERGEVAADTLSYYPAKSDADAETLLNHFTDIICAQTGKIMDKSCVVSGIGFAFPGPFDYFNGISWISGVSKFESLYGFDLRTELWNRLSRRKMFVSRISPQFHIAFENNADMFALGEWLIGEAKRYRKSICLTIGSGTGSAFVDNGQLIKSRPDVPPNGWVYRVPFRDSIVDDYISIRGILAKSRRWQELDRLDVAEIASLARNGQAAAQAVFEEFGTDFGRMLSLFTGPFQPDGLVIGGQIARSFDLFSASLANALGDESVPISLSPDTSLSTFAGISSWLRQYRDKEAFRPTYR